MNIKWMETVPHPIWGTTSIWCNSGYQLPTIITTLKELLLKSSYYSASGIHNSLHSGQRREDELNSTKWLPEKTD